MLIGVLAAGEWFDGINILLVASRLVHFARCTRRATIAVCTKWTKQKKKIREKQTTLNSDYRPQIIVNGREYQIWYFVVLELCVRSVFAHRTVAINSSVCVYVCWTGWSQQKTPNVSCTIFLCLKKISVFMQPHFTHRGGLAVATVWLVCILKTSELVKESYRGGRLWPIEFIPKKCAKHLLVLSTHTHTHACLIIYFSFNWFICHQVQQNTESNRTESVKKMQEMDNEQEHKCTQFDFKIRLSFLEINSIERRRGINSAVQHELEHEFLNRSHRSPRPNIQIFELIVY